MGCRPLTTSRVVGKEALLDGEGVEVNVLVANDPQTKTVFAHCVLCEGSDSDGYAIARVSEDIGRLGHK